MAQKSAVLNLCACLVLFPGMPARAGANEKLLMLPVLAGRPSAAPEIPGRTGLSPIPQAAPLTPALVAAPPMTAPAPVAEERRRRLAVGITRTAQVLVGAPADDDEKTKPSKPPSTALVVRGPQLGSEKQKIWLAFTRGFSQELEKEGYKPKAIAKAIDRLAVKSPDLVRNLATPEPPEAEEWFFKFEVKSRLLRRRVTRELARDEGFPREDIVDWFKRKHRFDWGETPLELIKRRVQDELAFDEGLFRRLLKGNYEGVLRAEEQVRRFRPELAEGLANTANLARRYLRIEALGPRSLRDNDMRVNYEIAGMRGDLTRYGRLKNIERQIGPTCAVHALHNILSGFLEERGVKPPRYSDFEAAARRALGIKVGEGIGPSQTSRIAELIGLKEVVFELLDEYPEAVRDSFNPLPENAEEFEQLLAGGQGAAYLTVRAREAEGRENRSLTHAMSVGERWVVRDEKKQPTAVYYSVSDSNGDAGVAANYTWAQLKPMLLRIILLKPADEAAFPAAVARFLRGKDAQGVPPRKPKKPQAREGAEEGLSVYAQQVFTLLRGLGISDADAHFFCRQVFAALAHEGWQDADIVRAMRRLKRSQAIKLLMHGSSLPKLRRQIEEVLKTPGQ